MTVSPGSRRGRWGRLVVADPEPVGEGAWALRGALPRHGINVFFVREGDGVTCFDAGSREEAGELLRLAGSFGGLQRIVLSHAHFDHRGGARLLGAPVYCHVDERADVIGDGGRRYWRHDGGTSALRFYKARLMALLRDAGPVPVAGVLTEGDMVGSFVVLHAPGHAPGQIALWRAADRALLAADCFYTLDSRTAALPHSVFGQDDAGAFDSLRRLAALEPAVAWPSHGPALVGDVSGALERALAGATG